MRRYKIVLMVILFLTILNNKSFAQNKEFIQVNMSGNEVQVRKVAVLLDGVTLKSETPSFIHTDRTLVPIRFVAENYGAKVDWEQKSKTATILHKDQEIKLTIDSPIALLNGETQILDKNSIARLASYEKNDARTMVPLAFITEVLGYQVGYDEIKGIPYINSKDNNDDIIEDLVEDVVENVIEEETTNTPPAANRIGPVELKEYDNRKAIYIEGAANSEYNIINLANPGRIVVDLLDSSLENYKEFTHNYDLSFIKGVRGSQFQVDKNYDITDKVVRVVLDLKEGTKDAKINIEKNGQDLIIYPEKSIWDQISYNIDGKKRVLNIKNMERTSYEIKDYPALKTLEIRIPTDNTELENGAEALNDGLVGEINVIRQENEVVVQLKYKRSIEYNIVSGDMDDNIRLEIMRNQDIGPKDRLIVIDPGHGGSDPGAISPNGILEKDINTSISLKTRDALEKLGYNILMTRDTDKTLKLSDRSKLANDNYADIFISFHANAFIGNSSIKGVQVLYCPAGKAVEKNEDQHPLAKYIMDELLKGTGAPDKGIISRSDLHVLRVTNMPAVLIEVGFLTNPEEEKLMQTDEYQDKIVKSVIKGIENYFEIY